MTATTGRASWRRAPRRCSRCRPPTPAATTRASIAFTSGTTGVPKGCVQFHRDVLAPCDTFARHLVGPKPGDVFLTSAPMAFTFGLGITPMFPLRFGAASATIEQGGPEKLLDAIVKHGVTHLGTAPTAYKAMLATEGSDPKPVRPELVEGLSLSLQEKGKSSPSTGSGRTDVGGHLRA